MAECHPVAFRWVMQAKTRTADPCKVIHADPRFTRTSAMADIYAPLRAGTDIVFLGALIRHMLAHHQAILDKPEAQRDERDRFYNDYLLHYTNAATLITDEFRDTEEMGGLFSGFDPATRRYDPRSWRYETEPGARPPRPGEPQGFSELVGRLVGPTPRRDLTLSHERCVFRILRRHYQRYTSELVEQVCGTPRNVFMEVADTLLARSGPDRTAAICYAVGWTQHTTGVQMIRAAAILQLLLGNIGRPGGGILALRGHATIQGSTDIATLYNLFPGYINAPSALRPHDTLLDYLRAETSASSYWSNLPQFVVSQLKAWYGDAATADNDYCFGYLPRNVGDHSHLPMFVAMHDGQIDGLFAMGQNPAVGGQNASYQREALARLKWLVVRDLYETETASFWKDSPEVKTTGRLRTEDIATEVFFLPAAAVPEMDGSFTNTQRLVQWHDRAVDPPDEARSDLWFTYHLGRRLRDLYRREGSDPERDKLILSLTWDYVDAAANEEWLIKDEPSAERVLREINGYEVRTGRPLRDFGELRHDGTTACGAWIYTGIYASGRNHAANREGDNWVSPGWGFAWPANRRILYNRASADPRGFPWRKERLLAAAHQQGGRRLEGYVYWDERARRWVGLDVPDFPADKHPTAPANPGGVGVACHDGASPFLMKADGKGWLYVPTGLVDGPLPAHYEPYESPVRNPVYAQQRNPAALEWVRPGNPYAPVGSPDYPHVLSTYRLTEHHLSGTMSRWLPWLAELQPELFCELSPEHAAEIGVNNTDWVRITTPRASIRAKALVTRRIRPFVIGGRTIHHVGLPWHWGYMGLTRGDVVNDLSALVGDPNVTIHEAKVFVCRVERAP
ncbi:MAG: molybdopterin-dependent oxidoreductase [Gemmataceae bacterium]|nr:molybdopterin-dependent oxidoreductase [Gemmataceae bacterium]